MTEFIPIGGTGKQCKTCESDIYIYLLVEGCSSGVVITLSFKLAILTKEM